VNLWSPSRSFLFRSTLLNPDSGPFARFFLLAFLFSSSPEEQSFSRFPPSDSRSDLVLSLNVLPLSNSPFTFRVSFCNRINETPFFSPGRRGCLPTMTGLPPSPLPLLSHSSFSFRLPGLAFYPGSFPQHPRPKATSFLRLVSYYRLP